MLSFSNIVMLLREAATSFGKDNAPRLAAALTYFTIFALVPLLILAITFITNLLTDPGIQERIIGFVADSVSTDLATALRDLLEERRGEVDLSRGITSGAIVGLGSLAWAATNLFVQLQASFNQLWNVPEEAAAGFGNQLRVRGKGLLMVLGFGVVLIAFFALNTYLSAAAGAIGESVGGFGTVLARLATFSLGALVLTGVFAVMFRVLPNVRLQWRDVTVGAAVTAVLFTLLQVFITWYFAKFSPGSAFGAYSSIILLLLWIYYNSMVLFFGAELTYAYAKHFGSTEALQSAKIKEDGYLSPREAKAIAYAAESGGALSPQDRRRAWERTTGREQPHTMLRVEQHTPREVLPSLSATLWNALSAVMAIPAVALLRLFNLKGSRHVVEQRHTVRAADFHGVSREDERKK